jgi:hypothetical protein
MSIWRRLSRQSFNSDLDRIKQMVGCEPYLYLRNPFTASVFSPNVKVQFIKLWYGGLVIGNCKYAVQIVIIGLFFQLSAT